MITEHPIVLFDGVCNFCNSSVQFIIKRDKAHQLRFGSLQSASGMQLKKQYAIPDDLDSVILIENGKYYAKSSAALHIADYFGVGWNLLKICFLVPRFIRDFFYDMIAKNRYKWFGKKETCMLPSKEQRALFLE